MSKLRTFVVLCALAWPAVPVVARAQPVLVPPAVVTKVEPAWPVAATERRHVDVAIEVELDTEGRITKTTVVRSGGAAFDQAALSAIERWTFHPATRDGKPIRARITATLHFAPPADPEPAAAPQPVDEPRPAVAPAAAAKPVEEVQEVQVVGETALRTRGAADFSIQVGSLRYVPRAAPSELLKLAPGILLTNEGGEGHPEQVFLRGFDAREGQDIEFSVGGVPINDVGNLHGNGVADTHFLIPELVTGLRVLEGPYAPQQGNFAVAGSADFQLGLETRGITGKVTTGSFGTRRLLLLYGPRSASAGTFAGAELFESEGFGSNRDARRGKILAQFETPLGRGHLRVTTNAYAANYHSAGVIREDDFRAGRIDFFGTYDPLQGGESRRYSLALDWDRPATDHDPVATRLLVYAIGRGMRTRRNNTGATLDPQLALQPIHPQRGDLLDTDFGGVTVGGRGLARVRGKLRDGGLPQELEVGWTARGDFVSSIQHRLERGTGVPYRIEDDLASSIGNLGLYLDGSLRPLKLLTVRGGVRADLFAYDVLDRCAVQDVPRPSATNPPGERSCYDQSKFGAYREPVQRASTASIAAMPRAAVLVGPVQGFTFSVAGGEGIRSIDPQYITQDARTPFARIRSWDGGVAYAHHESDFDLVVRSVFFQTRVERDLIFSQVEGRNVLAGGTSRTGWLGAVRATGKHFDQAASATLVRATFDDTKLLVPYVPDVVVRSDSALFVDLPHDVRAVFAAGVTFVGRRPLPFGERSDRIFTVDGSVTLKWSAFEAALIATNLLDARYRLGEFNYESDFGSAPNPTLVPARHFSAGAPRAVFVSLAATLGGN
jgi:TonB family protein